MIPVTVDRRVFCWVVARRRSGALDREAERFRPRLVEPALPAAARKGRLKQAALTVTGSLAIPEVPLRWETTVLSAYAASLLDGDDGDDAPGPRA